MVSVVSSCGACARREERKSFASLSFCHASVFVCESEAKTTTHFLLYVNYMKYIVCKYCERLWRMCKARDGLAMSFESSLVLLAMC